MNASSPRPNSMLVAGALAFLAGAAILLAGIRLASGTPPPLDPVVLADHGAPPCLDAGVPLINPPPMVLRPSWGARAIAFGRDLGKRTGGSGVVLALGAIVDRIRDAKPSLKRGRIGRFTLGLWAALLWTAGSLATGATWATAASGVVLALITGAVWAAVPGEGAAKKPAGDGAA